MIKETLAEESVGKVPKLGKDVAKATNNVVTTGKTPTKVNVLPSMSEETLLDLDSKGVELYFGQKEDFLVLSETTIRTLAQANRIRYSSSRQFHDTWRGQQSADFVEAFSVDREFVGSDLEKLYDIKVNPNLEYRWARPDKVADYSAKGYHMANPDEAKTFLGAKGSRHEISHNGKTELVLMVVSKEIYRKRQAEKVAKNKNRAVAWKDSGVEQLRAGGGAGFVDESAASGSGYSEIE